MGWAWGKAGVGLPNWVGNVSYGERFRVEPHLVNPPFLWWVRIQQLDRARQWRDAREFVEKHTLAKADAATQALYNELVVLTRNG